MMAKKLKCDRTLYGKLVKLGDYENPKASIRLINGATINTHVKRKDIYKYRDFLFEDVRIKGEATITTKGFDIVRFDLEEMIPFSLMSIDETTSQFRSILKKE